MRASIPASLLLLLTTAAIALTPPAIEWERTYFPGRFSRFYDVNQTSDGGFIAAGFIVIDFSSPADTCLFKFDSSGNLQWASETEYYNKSLRKVLQMETNEYIAIGAVEASQGSTISLLLLSTNEDGNTIWSQVIEYENAKTYGIDFAVLPDGGFAICGEIDPTEGMNQAWILRTDAQGDTLWTREWGWVYNDKAMSILYIDNGLTVLTQGRLQTTTGGPHLVRYDMDGNLLWETNLPEWPSVSAQAQTMCEASDGGLLLMDNYWPTIMHTDYVGNPDWWFWPPGSDQPYGYSLSTTMDGGILYGGEERGGPSGSKSICGIIARYDSQGNGLWSDHIYECDIIYSARQLSHGGYIAAGETGLQGFLIKYAPELGFESQESSPSLEISSISPNPFSAVTEIQFTLVEAGDASLTVYDLNGRVVDVLGEGVFAEGEHSLQWAPGGIASGCYMVRLTTADNSITDNAVFLK